MSDCREEIDAASDEVIELGPSSSAWRKMIADETIAGRPLRFLFALALLNELGPRLALAILSHDQYSGN